jgi:uncharacterized protein (DUF1330 family)
MTIQPSAEQLKKFIEKIPSGPVTMLNLLKFKEKAAYADGRESNLSGQEAYGLYGIEMAKMIEADGGRIVFSAATNTLVIGEGELQWDMVAIAEYASLESFQKIMSSPEYQKIATHREAGLAHQLLINLLTN